MIEPRAIVIQMGARHNYAIARMLHARNALAGLYTDLCWSERSRSPYRWICPHSGAVARRTVTSVPANLVCASAATTILGRMCRTVCTSRAHRVEDTLLGWHAIRHGIRDANVVYAMFGNGEPFLHRAARRGLRIVSEVFGSPLFSRIEARERASYPDWEPKGPRPESVARGDAKVSRMIRFSDMLVCPARPVVDGLATFPEFDERKCRIIPYGTSVAIAAPPTPIRGRILCAGAVKLMKGIHYLAAAASDLRETNLSIEVVVAGRLPAEIGKRPEVRALTFLGHLGPAEMQSEFAKADVFVLPSLSEGSAGVVYEALAAGVPVVTTPSAGSVVSDGREGFIVPERDSAAIAGAVRAIVGDRALRGKLSFNARETSKLYSEELWGDRLFGALRELVNTRSMA